MPDGKMSRQIGIIHFERKKVSICTLFIVLNDVINWTKSSNVLSKWVSRGNCPGQPGYGRAWSWCRTQPAALAFKKSDGLSPPYNKTIFSVLGEEMVEGG